MENKRVSFGFRLVASLIDGIFLFMVLSIIGFLIDAFGVSKMMTYPPFYNPSYMYETGFISYFLSSTAFSPFLILGLMLMETYTGKTPGKFMLQIQIGQENGNAASRKILATRSAIKYGSWAFQLVATLIPIEIVQIFVSGAGFVYSITIFVGCFFVLGSKKQAFHDRYSGTAVFEIDDLQYPFGDDNL